MTILPMHNVAARIWHARPRAVQVRPARPVSARSGAARLVALAAFTLLWFAIITPLSAQVPAETDGGETTVSTNELEDLVETLESPVQRERFLTDLKAALAATKTDPAEDRAEGASATLAISGGLAVVGDQLVLLAREIANIPDAVGWVSEAWGESRGRNVWLISLGKLLAVILGGIAAGFIAHLALRKPRRRIEKIEKPSRWLRPLALFGYHLLRLVPHLIMVGVGYGVLAVIEPGETVRLVSLSFINAHLIASIVKVAGNQALAPYTPQFRLTAFKDETAFYCVIWWRRLVNITVYGYFFCQAVLLLGLPESGYAALVRLLGVIVVGLLIVLILQNRAPFARYLREAGCTTDRKTHFKLFALLARLGDFWHIPAILYVIAGGLLAAAQGLEGFLFLAKSTGATIAIVWAVGFATAALRRGFIRGFRVKDELRERYPALEARLNRYLPLLRTVLQVLVLLIGAILVLEAWNVDVFDWLVSDSGRAVIGALASIIAIIVIAMIVLEVAATLIDRYLTSVDEDGGLVERSQRARTLLPLARNALRVVVSVVAILMILSEVGIDIAPVLAGVGVVGLAIGFGAQTLVKDIITGLFILLEDSVSVGDVVNAGGHSGSVEAITIRSIRLRDLSGSVHTVPFSAVDTVTNMTKEFSYYVVDAGVAYREDYDEVVEIMRDVGDDLQDDPNFGPNMLAPLEIMGLNEFGDSAVVIRARLKTLPIKQWSVGREYNRRLKAAFDAHGIEIPFPHTTIYFGEDKEGQAPAGRLVLEGDRAGKTRARPAEPKPVPDAQPVTPAAGETPAAVERSVRQRRQRPDRSPAAMGEDDGDGDGDG
jgi:small conductance mechanosensitive channel